MIKKEKSRKMTDLLHLAILIAILALFAKYETDTKRQAVKINVRNETKTEQVKDKLITQASRDVDFNL